MQTSSANEFDGILLIDKHAGCTSHDIVNAVRRRLKMGEGGSVYIFATTLADRTHVLLVCSKVSQS